MILLQNKYIERNIEHRTFNWSSSCFDHRYYCVVKLNKIEKLLSICQSVVMVMSGLQRDKLSKCGAAK